MTEVRRLRPGQSDPQIPVSCDELALQIARQAVDIAREARDTATESALNGARIETMLRKHLDESKKQTRSTLLKGAAGSSVLVALIGVIGQVQVASITSTAREQAKEAAQATAQADDGRASQVAQAAAREAVRQVMAEREAQRPMMRVTAAPSAIARRDPTE